MVDSGGSPHNYLVACHQDISVLTLRLNPYIYHSNTAYFLHLTLDIEGKICLTSDLWHCQKFKLDILTPLMGPYTYLVYPQ